MIDLHRKYATVGQPLADYFKELLLHLDEDINLIKNSVLSEYVSMQQGYDPFFLHHLNSSSKLRPHPAVNRIFSLTMTYTARLIKVNKQLLDMVSSGTYRALLPKPRRYIRDHSLPLKNKEHDKTFVNFRRRAGRNQSLLSKVEPETTHYRSQAAKLSEKQQPLVK